MVRQLRKWADEQGREGDSHLNRLRRRKIHQLINLSYASLSVATGKDYFPSSPVSQWYCHKWRANLFLLHGKDIHTWRKTEASRAFLSLPIRIHWIYWQKQQDTSVCPNLQRYSNKPNGKLFLSDRWVNIVPLREVRYRYTGRRETAWKGYKSS